MLQAEQFIKAVKVSKLECSPAHTSSADCFLQPSSWRSARCEQIHRGQSKCTGITKGWKGKQHACPDIWHQRSTLCDLHYWSWCIGRKTATWTFKVQQWFFWGDTWSKIQLGWYPINKIVFFGINIQNIWVLTLLRQNLYYDSIWVEGYNF